MRWTSMKAGCSSLFLVLAASSSRLCAQDSASLVCEVSCDPVQPRTPVATLVWKVSEEPLEAKAIAARAAAQTLEVTVFKDGFEKGTFATVSAMAGPQRFAMSAAAGPAPKALPGLDRLVMVDVKPVSDPTDPNRADPQARAAANGRFNYISVRVEGLEPGLNYFWRTATPTAGAATGERPELVTVVRCQAPVCPADFVTKPK